MIARPGPDQDPLPWRPPHARGHGTDLLLTKDGPQLQQQIVDFLKSSSPL